MPDEIQLSETPTIQAIDGRISTLEGVVVSGNAAPYATWVGGLADVVPTEAGVRASVLPSDEGTHDDPVTDEVGVPNSGIYASAADGGGFAWQRIFDYEIITEAEVETIVEDEFSPLATPLLASSETIRGSFSAIEGTGIIGGAAVSAAADWNGVCVAVDCGVDFEPQLIDGIHCNVAPAADTYLVASIYERKTSSANIDVAPVLGEDSKVASGQVTGDEYLENGRIIPTTRYLARAGYSYFMIVESLAIADGARVSFGVTYATVADAATRFEGYYRKLALDFVNWVNTRRFSLSLISAKIIDVAAELEQLESNEDAELAEAYREMVYRNETQVKADCFAEPNPAALTFRRSGDSLGEQATGAPSRTSSEIAARLMDSTVLNVSQGGLKSDGLLTLLDARAASEWALVNLVNISTNDEGPYIYSTTKANVDTLISRFTGEWCFSPAIATSGGRGHEKSDKQRLLLRELRADNSGLNAARIWDYDNLTIQLEDVDDFIDGDATDDDDNDIITVDGLHANEFFISKLGLEEIRIYRALAEVGAAYAQEEVLLFRANDPVGTVYSKGLIMGRHWQSVRRRSCCRRWFRQAAE